jgi:asparagine synthase (glutamine-hydrolysing)
VQPGEWQLFGPDGLRRCQPNWSVENGVEVQPPTVRLDDRLDDLQSRLDASVRFTLRSDVPVGLFLSGGVDSAVIAESAARLGSLDAAFCVDFADQGFSEFTRASHVAKELDLELVRVPLDSSVLQEFLSVTEHLDDPLADSSAMAVWTVARAAARRLKVVLSGDGGDELFGGYLTYRASQWHRRIRRWLPQAAAAAISAVGDAIPVNTNVKVGTSYKLQRFLRALPLDSRCAHFTWNGTWLPHDAAKLCAPGLPRTAAANAVQVLGQRHSLSLQPSIRDLQVADIREYLPNDILTKVDRSTMAHGLESRAPFLNPAIASLALSLPEPLRVDRRHGKVLLRRLCARHFGEEHANAPKQGFSLPIHQWLRNGGRPLMTSLLASERVAATGVLDPDAVTHAVNDHLSGNRALGWELWGLMVFVAWYEQRVAHPPDLRRLPDPQDIKRVVITPPAAA